MEWRLPNGVEGAYYSKLLLVAKEQKRIDFVPVDPLMQVRAYST
jgi:phage terminase large subunit